MSWRENIDPTIRNHLELQIKESHKHKESYSEAIQPSNAQLWIAIANLSQQIHKLNSKINSIEKDIYELKIPESKRKEKKAYDLIESINQL
ncbi:hypothetical protein J4459_03395 [Candidatus Woesearchaeota archaeon]|nr:hypothetical protein [Candidatus Woesearchaeota archaeon]